MSYKFFITLYCVAMTAYALSFTGNTTAYHATKYTLIDTLGISLWLVIPVILAYWAGTQEKEK